MMPEKSVKVLMQFNKMKKGQQKKTKAEKQINFESFQLKPIQPFAESVERSCFFDTGMF